MVPNRNYKLWLIWKDIVTRERFVVGILEWKQDAYFFRYLDNEGKNNLNEAIKQGFMLLPAFPERDKEYVSEKLFQTFLNRLPNRKRKDVQRFFIEQNLPVDCSDFDFLKETGGRLPTDTLEFVEPLVFQTEEEFEIDFYVAGTRYYSIDEAEMELTPGSKLLFRLEPENEFDPHAIEIFTLSNKKLGYVPVFYSRYLDLLVKNKQYTATVLMFNSEADYNEKLKVSVKGKSNLSEIIETLNGLVNL
ncbi:HIRAN domain-containing protein [Aneurinibacillus tyrosinisolvens]|uniref:HIRAN domain-containing protein n=1 Tax=Aneurinibacillus tyrosinisolvens TaxID=1443435 RepID=UPI00063F4687|nr:HIRAN domain-containing protein [Aneurinibacillus tyrosinisolvens]